MAPGEEALDHLLADLVALDEEPEHFGPEELLNLIGVEVEEVTKAAVREPTAVGEQHVQVGMPAQQLARRLHEADRLGRDVVAAEAGEQVEPQGSPGTSGQLSQQAAVEAEEDPQPLWEGEDDLPMGNLFEQLLSRPLRPLRIEADWAVGSPVRFFDRDSQDLTDSGVVLECDPPPLPLVYTLRNEPDAAAGNQGDSRVSFSIEPHEGAVKLTLVHDELPDAQAAAAFREGWAPILASLKALLETGKPLPQLRSFEERASAKPQVGS